MKTKNASSSKARTPNPCPSRDHSIYLDDLRLVGTTKLLGYLPLSTIVKLCQADPQALIAQAAARGLSARIFAEGECDVASGALYVFAAAGLSEFLCVPENAQVLRQNQWPTEAHAYVHKVATEFAEREALYDLVALSFNDPRVQYLDRWRTVVSSSV
jgi:hypothetical protein